MINSLALQDVKFPLTLDVYELCSLELQQKLIPVRDRFKIMDDKKLEEEKVERFFAFAEFWISLQVFLVRYLSFARPFMFGC